MASTRACLRIGVIGIGGRGKIVRHAHQPERGIVVVAGADPNEATYTPFRAAYGDDVYVTNDYRKLLTEADVDAVFIASPDYLHEEQVVAALQAGKAVYLEKPMAISVEGADRILRTAVETGSRLYVGHNMRHMKFVRKMKQLIDDGAIGEVRAAWCRHFVGYGGDAFFKDWHAEQQYANSLLLQKGVHDIDILHYLCGGHAVRVQGMGGLCVYNQDTNRRAPDQPPDTTWRNENWPPMAQQGLNPTIDVEDVSHVHMQLNTGAFVTYQQCHFTPDAWRNYTIIGTEGRLENFGDYKGDCVIGLWNRRCHYEPKGHRQFVVQHSGTGHGGADQQTVNEFLAHIKDDAETRVSPIAARNAVAVGCLAAQSIRNNGGCYEVPPVPDWVREAYQPAVGVPF